MRYTILGQTPTSGQWRWGQQRSLEAIDNYKQLLSEYGKNEKTITQEEIDTWWLKKNEAGDDIDLLRLSNNGKPEHYVAPTNEKYANSLWTDLKPNGSSQLKSIFGKKIFDTPKSVDLITRLLKLADVKGEDLVLDSFAGSGTTGHAVLQLNEEDGGNRKFVLVECENYANELTAERIRKIISGKKNSFSYFQIGDAVEIDKILDGKNLPTYEELAKYVFFTATGERFDPKKINQKSYYIGSSSTFEVYLIYEPNKEKLKTLSLNLDLAQEINNKNPNKQKLVFAPCCFIEEFHLKEYGIRFAQLPFEIYRIAE